MSDDEHHDSEDRTEVYRETERAVAEARGLFECQHARPEAPEYHGDVEAAQGLSTQFVKEDLGKRIVHADRARPKPAYMSEAEQEAGQVLRLGELEDVVTLSNGEAYLVVHAILDHRVAKRPNTDVLTKAIQYLDAFTRVKNRESIEAIRRLVDGYQQLAKFERAQLASLFCETAEEALTLIPSLSGKINESDLQYLLDEMDKYRKLDLE